MDSEVSRAWSCSSVASARAQQLAARSVLDRERSRNGEPQSGKGDGWVLVLAGEEDEDEVHGSLRMSEVSVCLPSRSMPAIPIYA